MRGVYILLLIVTCMAAQAQVIPKSRIPADSSKKLKSIMQYKSLLKFNQQQSDYCNNCQQQLRENSDILNADKQLQLERTLQTLEQADDIQKFDEQQTVTKEVEQRKSIIVESSTESLIIESAAERIIIGSSKGLINGEIPGPLSPDERPLGIDRAGRSRFDSRFELLELNTGIPDNLIVIRNSFSVYAMILRENLERTSSGSYRLVNVQTSGQKLGLCPGEPYRNQISVSVGTAFLITPDLMLTAFHCVEPHDLQNLYFVKGFKVIDVAQHAQVDFEPEDVLSGSSLLQDDYLRSNDLAVVRIRASAALNFPLDIDFDFTARTGTFVYTLGYPLGLPIKFATNGSITGLKRTHFETSLDTYQGNSGSPVFDSRTHKVIGVLVGGLQDFVSMGNCNISNTCYSQDCATEKVVYLSSLKELIAGSP